MSTEQFRPQVLEADEPVAAAARLQPQVFATEQGGRIVPADAPAAALPVAPPKRRKSRIVSLAFTGITVFVGGWMAVEAADWITDAFARSTALGVVASAAVAAGTLAAFALIGHELRSLYRLRNVEAMQRAFAAGLDQLRPAKARGLIADALQVIPREPATVAAIEAFQRQVQAHHSASQQAEILSRTVLSRLDRQAETFVRSAVLRAFGITAISPTALTDTVFFLACGVRMLRNIAACYGHRPTTAATMHLLRRLLLEAGKLGAVDLASASIVQHLGGALTERLASSAADSLYASYRMARLGVIVMELCRPIPFRAEDVPNVTSLVTNVMRRRDKA
ncbi:MAG TPA: TIGR01620 family protein [Xanthobacteraceae bacterium]|jgi:putative membrane protein|nr:TIGR01620 family protein [Xanthobacteraceae bacterium]